MQQLTDDGVTAAKKQTVGRVCFGRGLWLDKRGPQPRWVFRYISPVTMREREYAIGTEDVFSSLGKVKAAHNRAVGEVAAGICPVDRRKRELALRVRAARTLYTADGMTLQTALEKLVIKLRTGWRNPKSEHQWWQTFEKHVLPRFGSTPVASLEPEHIAQMLTGGSNPWVTAPTTGQRLHARIRAVIDHADSLERRVRANPADMRVLSHLLPAQPRRVVRHHPAPMLGECPTAFVEQTSGESMSALAVALVALTAVRVGTACKVMWNTVDFDAAVWRIKRRDLKTMLAHDTRDEFVVPLSKQALGVLRKLAELAEDRRGYILASPLRRSEPLHPQAVLAHLKRITPEYSVHGWRAAFATKAVDAGWCSMVGNGKRPYDELISIALDHTFSQGAAWQAYQRGTLLERRRELMQRWADFLDPPALREQAKRNREADTEREAMGA